MRKCEWCNNETKRTFTCTNLGSTYTVCPTCMTKLNAKICRVCGGTLGNHSIKGVCLSCIQMGNTQEAKAKEEELEGTSLEQLQPLTESVTFAEADFNNWVRFSPTRGLKQRR